MPKKLRLYARRYAVSLRFIPFGRMAKISSKCILRAGLLRFIGPGEPAAGRVLRRGQAGPLGSGGAPAGFLLLFLLQLPRGGSWIRPNLWAGMRRALRGEERPAHYIPG